MRDVNSNVFSEIQKWVQECFTATGLHRAPSLAEATMSFPVLDNRIPAQLFTGLVITSKLQFTIFKEFGQRIWLHTLNDLIIKNPYM